MNVIQLLVDAMSKQEQEERARNQLTLGALIALLDAYPQAQTVRGLGKLDSYRGYKEDEE